MLKLDWQLNTNTDPDTEMDASEETVSQKSRMISEGWALIRSLVIVLLLSLLFFRVLFINIYIPSESMVPTLQVGDYIACSHINYMLNMAQPERGDIVIFRHAASGTEMLIKRVIGMPGDTVTIPGDGLVYVNGELLDEPYLPTGTETIAGDVTSFTVPEGSYFMMGDNRSHSFDSRFWVEPYVTLEEIQGKTLFRFYPFSRIGRDRSCL